MEKIEKEVDEHEIPLQKKLIKQIQELLSFQYTTIKLCHPKKDLISRGRPSPKRKRVKSTKRLPSKVEIEQDILNCHKRFLKKIHRATIGTKAQFMRGKKFYLMQKEASQDDETTKERKRKLLNNIGKLEINLRPPNNSNCLEEPVNGENLICK